ncbi:flippase-like domain-containing protein [Methanoculleus sp. Wushi-C6]|uniref:Flippase-like domain-containing protein n=1 Tax=Methanoculleus caldifontis TaxID=2651577 RepID=A0ABU3X1U0_9EURY|nr:lysylphosphatidylglycerol synthase transmembrane domain-containing protein [Methanoculleus sp. Wushi-C6]MDV2482020.1 flippase-like domain-containing protein [Methanoculleus sp. Wushi-C6]
MRFRVTRQGAIQLLLLLIGLVILAYFISQSGIIGNLWIITTISIPLLVVAFALSLANIGSKVYRWKYLSRYYYQEISWYDASLVSVSSLFFANITPGKVGDLYKAYFMKRKYGLQFLDGVSMLFYERFFELTILFLVAAGIVMIQLRAVTVIALEFTLLVLFLLLVLYYKADFFMGLAEKVLVRLPIEKREQGPSLHIRKMPLSNIIVVFLITLISLVLEFIRLWCVAMAFGFLLNPIQLSIFMSLAFIIGLASQIPLGVGAMEGSLNYFITSMGVPSATAIAIVLVDRTISMYFALVLGFVFSKFSLDALKDAVNA